MSTINIRERKGATFLKFPDGQTHVNLDQCERHTYFDVVAHLTNNDSVIELMQVANAIDHGFCHKNRLIIPYLQGARSDRVMRKGDSVDLEVIASIINSLEFNEVILYDVHSDVAKALIKRSRVITNKQLVDMYRMENAVLISPDAGSAKKLGDYFNWMFCVTDAVQCIKSRNMKDGAVNLKVLQPEVCKDRNCVIIDDICDGGATFLAIAEQIDPAHLTLVVTHGIFSKGFEKLEEKFDRIVTSDSFKPSYDSKIVSVFPFTPNAHL